MNCMNCGHAIYYRICDGWTHKRSVWETSAKIGEPLIRRLNECRDCGCEKPEPEARSEKGSCVKPELKTPDCSDKGSNKGVADTSHEKTSPRKPELFKCTIADWKGKKAQISFAKEKKVRA